MAVIVDLIVDVIVDVCAPVIVAALLNGNDAVSVIDAVDAQASINVASIPAVRSSNAIARASAVEPASHFWLHASKRVDRALVYVEPLEVSMF
jgi:hypothetical protein